jgi:hypothetical protein
MRTTGTCTPRDADSQVTLTFTLLTATPTSGHYVDAAGPHRARRGGRALATPAPLLRGHFNPSSRKAATHTSGAFQLTATSFMVQAPMSSTQQV